MILWGPAGTKDKPINLANLEFHCLENRVSTPSLSFISTLFEICLVNGANGLQMGVVKVIREEEVEEEQEEEVMAGKR